MPIPQPSRRRLRSAAAHATSACCRHDVNVTAVSHAMPTVDIKRCCSMLAPCSHRAGAVCTASCAARAMRGPLLSLQPRSRSRSHDLLLCCPCSRCIELIDADSRRLPRRLPGNEGRVFSTSSRRVLEVMPSCDFGGLEGMWKVVTCGSRHVQPACSDSCYVCVRLPYRVAASGRPPVRAIASDVSVS